MIMTDVKTKPCPFCGCPIPVVITVSEFDGFRLACRKCFALTDWFETEEKAVAAWNKRTPYEDDDWFYLPKPKNSIVQYGSPQIEKTENGYKAEQPIEIIESAICAWGDKLGEHVMKRIGEVWCGTCHIIASSTDGLCTDNPRHWFKLSCGHSFKLAGLKAPIACAVCGKRVSN